MIDHSQSLRRKRKHQNYAPLLLVAPLILYFLCHILEIRYLINYKDTIKNMNYGDVINKLIGERVDTFYKNQTRLNEISLKSVKSKTFSTAAYLPFIIMFLVFFKRITGDDSDKETNYLNIGLLIILLGFGFGMEGFLFGWAALKNAFYTLLKTFGAVLILFCFKRPIGIPLYFITVLFSLSYILYTQHISFVQLENFGLQARFHNLPPKLKDLINSMNMHSSIRILFNTINTNARNRQSFNLQYILLLFRGTEPEPNFLIFSLAHEIGHIKSNHVFMGMFIVLLAPLIFDIAKLVLVLSINHKIRFASKLLIAVFLIYSFMICWYPFIEVPKNYVSKIFETKADSFAAKYVDDKMMLGRGIVTLLVDGESLIDHSRLYNLFFVDYPDTIERIRNITK